MTKWTPNKGDLEVPMEVLYEARTIRGAILNLPPEGTYISAEVDNWKVSGRVIYVNPEYGTIVLRKEVWTDSHFKGNIEVRIDVGVGWDIEILEEAL